MREHPALKYYYPLSNDIVLNAVGQYLIDAYLAIYPFFAKEEKESYIIYCASLNRDWHTDHEWGGPHVLLEIDGPFYEDRYLEINSHVPFFILKVDKERAFNFYTSLLERSRKYLNADFTKGIFYYVDEEIAPLVSFINRKFSPYMFTIFSCQGDDSVFYNGVGSTGYVSVVCFDMHLLDELIEALDVNSVRYSAPSKKHGIILPYFSIYFPEKHGKDYYVKLVKNAGFAMCAI